MIYYTADLHFTHNRTPLFEKRPFYTPEEMNEALIAKWNEKVRDCDTVYLLGDIGYHNEPVPYDLLGRLSGHKHLIRGNHDTGIEENEKLFDYFETVTDFNEIDDGDTHIMLCHYPVVYFHSGFMIHGHYHETSETVKSVLGKMPRLLNAGTDVNGYYPVTLAELIRNNKLWYQDEKHGELPEFDAEERPKNGGTWKADFKPLPGKK